MTLSFWFIITERDLNHWFCFAASNISIKIDGVKTFTYKELALATGNFSSSTVLGQGGYGKVYKGILSDKIVVAIKRAEEGSLQGQKEFLTEIELLSRLHHRNLVSLIGYCDEEGEQVYCLYFELCHLYLPATSCIRIYKWKGLSVFGGGIID